MMFVINSARKYFILFIIFLSRGLLDHWLSSHFLNVCLTHTHTHNMPTASIIKYMPTANHYMYIRPHYHLTKLFKKLFLSNRSNGVFMYMYVLLYTGRCVLSHYQIHVLKWYYIYMYIHCTCTLLHVHVCSIHSQQ